LHLASKNFQKPNPNPPVGIIIIFVLQSKVMRIILMVFAALAVSFLHLGCRDSTPPAIPNSELPSAQNNAHTSTDQFLVSPESGKILKQIDLGDGGGSIALYLPASYTTNEQYPVIYCFDPDGNGSFPLERYKALAEEFGYILIGSNTSKNGSDANQLSAHLQRLLPWATNHYAIDKAQQYAIGFSGGARVAAGLAQNNPAIRAVIGCSAGFTPSSQRQFPFLGMVGDGDFNYREMKQLEALLNTTAAISHLTVFHGTHQWPEMEVARDAFLFTKLEGERGLGAEKDDWFITNTYEHEIAFAARLIADENLIAEGIQQARKVAAFYSDLIDLTAVEQLIKTAESTDVWQEYQNELKLSLAVESRLQAEYMSIIADHLTAWKDEVTRLNKAAAATDASLEKARAQRLKGYMGIMAYSLSNRALRQGDLVLLRKNLLAYQAAEPNNSEWAYLRAVLLMRENDASGALQSLEQSFELGFDDLQRFETDPEFEFLRSLPEYSEFASKLTN
jgi:dienelactone hydrolase